MNDRPEHQGEREFNRKREKLNVNVVSFSQPRAAEAAGGPMTMNQPLLPVDIDPEGTERGEVGRGKNGQHNPPKERRRLRSQARRDAAGVTQSLTHSLTHSLTSCLPHSRIHFDVWL